MSYRINKTDGTLLVDLVDGAIDTGTTDITLVGKNYKGFGEHINENFIALLENFSSSTAPANPIKGQLWYDTANQKLKIYDGTIFKVSGTPSVSATQPQNLVEGDLWINNSDKKLYFFDGVEPVLVGPTYTAAQGKTVYEAFTTTDVSNQNKTVLLGYINGVLAEVHSRTEFLISSNSDFAIPNYPVDPDDVQTPKRQRVKVGVNLTDPTNYIWNGTADTANNLKDTGGNSYAPTDFVSTNARDSLTNQYIEQSTLGSLFVKGETGLAVGVGATKYATFKVDQGTTNTVIELQQLNQDFAIQVRSGSDSIDAIFVDSSAKNVGVFKNNPSEALDVDGNGKFSGNVTVEGDLTVNGGTTNLQVTTLQSQDKNIELGYIKNDDSSLTEGDDASVNGAGITVVSSNGSKDIAWYNSTGNWTSNQHFDLTENHVYKINNSTVLTNNSLGTGITSALGLTQVGTLVNLSTTALTVTGGTITSSSALALSSGGTITVNTQKITGVSDPTTSTDVATKNYVDTEIDSLPVILSLDVTGLTDPGGADGPYNDVISILNIMSPPADKAVGTVARVFTTNYGASTVTITNTDLNGSRNRTFENVDANGTLNESVLKDISFNTISGAAVTLSVTRKTMNFSVSGSNAWQWVSTTAYP